MTARTSVRKVFAGGACAGAIVLALGGTRATAEVDAGASGACGSWEVEYALMGNLRLTDTPMGAGNGTHRVGPGKLVLRFEAGRSTAAMRSYEMPERFVIHVNEVLLASTLTTNATTRATAADPCGNVAEGILNGRTLRWTTQTTGYRTDGVLACDGSLCGSFGAPPKGSSPLHIGPSSVQLAPFEFDREMQTFTMQSTFVSKTDAPQQTAHLALSGREERRTCVPAEPCR